MYKLNLVLGATAMDMLLGDDLDKKTDIYKIVKQHTLKYSEKIQRYYEDSLEETAMLFASFIGKHGNVYDVELEDDILAVDGEPTDELLEMARKDTQQDCILIGEKSEFEGKDLSGIDFYDYERLQTSRSCDTLKKYTMPYQYDIDRKTDISDFGQWLGKLCECEDCITIIDPYIFAKQANNKMSGFDVFSKYILKHIRKGTNIEIFTSCEKSERSDDEIEEIINSKLLKKWKIKVYDINYHDRYIWCKNWKVLLQVGLDLCDYDGKITRYSTSVKWDNEKKPALPLQRTLMCGNIKSCKAK